MPDTQTKRPLILRRAISIVAALTLCALALMAASGGQTPIGPRWWPSQWGADDQRGTGNRMTPAHVLQASRLIRTGKVYSLGKVYEYGMPIAGKRHFSLTIPGSPTGGPTGGEGGGGKGGWGRVCAGPPGTHPARKKAHPRVGRGGAGTGKGRRKGAPRPKDRNGGPRPRARRGSPTRNPHPPLRSPPVATHPPR